MILQTKIVLTSMSFLSIGMLCSCILGLIDMQIRSLVGALRPMVPSASMSGGAAVSARDTPVLDACQQLTGLLAEQQERRSTFMAENGVAALIELLDERNAKVRTAITPLATLHKAGVQPSLGSLLLQCQVQDLTQ